MRIRDPMEHIPCNFTIVITLRLLVNLTAKGKGKARELYSRDFII
jgi:hypothetical protein